MTKKTHKNKNNDEWIWEQNEEVVEALRKLHQIQHQKQSKLPTNT